MVNESSLALNANPAGTVEDRDVQGYVFDRCKVRVLNEW